MLVRTVHAASRQRLFNHEGTAAQAGVADALILVGVSGPGGEGRHCLDAGEELAQRLLQHAVAEPVRARGVGGVVCL